MQHGDDVLGGIVAKELAQCFLVPRDAVCIDQCDEIPLRIARQRRFGEMWVGADEGLWIGVQIGEVAAPAARNADLLARCACVIHQQGAPRQMCRRHHACGARADDCCIKFHSPRGARGRARGQAFVSRVVARGGIYTSRAT